LAVGLVLVACTEEEEEVTPQPGPSVASSQADATAKATAEGSAAAAPASASAQVEPERLEPRPDLADMPSWGDKRRFAGTREEQNELLFRQLVYAHQLKDAQMEEVRRIFAASSRLSQGNPKLSRHPVTMAECFEKLKREKVDYDDDGFMRICGDRFMAPLYDPDKETAEGAKVCIDQLEFPNIPCTYPVTWVRASEAVALCRAVGKRLCDAHEWEGACAGQLLPPDYNFGIPKRYKKEPEEAIKRMRAQHNIRIHEKRRWAYGEKPRKGICGTGSHKSKSCGVGWSKCGTNTYPAGYFPACKSALSVYDQHGNAAEHMNLPLSPSQMASDPSGEYGHTEMKGSWFIFDSFEAHEDHCRWRAPYWHGARVLQPKNHRNYHLGFRCCKSLPAPP